MEDFTGYLQEIAEETELRLDEYGTYPLAFTAFVLEQVSTLSNIGYYEIIHCENKSADDKMLGEIYGYSLSENEEMLTLYYSVYKQSDTVGVLYSADYQSILNRLQGYYLYIIKAGYLDYDETDPVYQILKNLYEKIAGFNSVKLCILSNQSIKDYVIKNNRIAGKSVITEVWDLKKLYAIFHSGLDHLCIDVDFQDEFKAYQIPFIQMQSKEYEYKCMLSMFPAMLLYKLYEKYNTDLLLSNVRYFLGFKGSKKKNANIGIQNTLLKENEMFLAYNNGITALATTIDTDKDFDVADIESEVDSTSDDSRFDNFISTGVLRCIHDFRIVNGGQTTASIYFTKKEKGAHLRGVFVPVKIIVLSKDKEKVAGNISRYSNSQSPIKYADFSVSNEFNVALEMLSRKVIAPTADSSPQHWYFERVRGQYDQEKKKKTKREDVVYFQMLYPKEKKFTKEIFAKVRMCWGQEPNEAVKGAGTTYDTFMERQIRMKYIPDENYFKESIGLLILYHFLESRPENKQYGNKKAAVIAYTMALLKYYTHDRFDLMAVWNRQALSDASIAYLNRLAEAVKDALTQLAGESGVLSYSKKKQAFKELCDFGIPVRIDDIKEDMI